MVLEDVIKYLKNVFPSFKGRLNRDLYDGFYIILQSGFVRVLLKEKNGGIYCEVLSHYNYDFNNTKGIYYNYSDIFDFFNIAVSNDYKNGNYVNVKR